MADRGLCVGSFGEKLRRERELRAITIQEISVATKIGTRILTALEEEDFDKLPGGIFNKGFVRAYARYVGIDEEKAVADYLEAAADKLPDPEFQVVANQMEAARLRDLEAAGVSGRNTVNIKAAILALILLAAVAAGYHWRRAFPSRIDKIKIALKGEKKPAPATTSNTQLTTAPAPLPVTAPAPQEPAAMTPAQPDANSAAPSSTPPTTPATTVTPTALTTPTPEVKQPSPPASTAAVDGITLQIEATAKSWVAVTTDSKTTTQAILDPGSETLHTRSFKAQNRITLITGNPAGLQVTYNGRKLEPWTGPGRRMTVTFTPEGYTVQ